MKKALSILLAVIAVASLAIPMASAEQEVALGPPLNVKGTLTPASETLYVDPADGITFVKISLPTSGLHDTGCAGVEGGNLFFWGFMPGYETFQNYVTWRPERNPSSPADINNTLTNIETMTVAVTSGIQPAAEVTVVLYAQCIYCGFTYTITIKIVPAKKTSKPGQDLLSILKTWWFDLKWTWDFQIHPFFKYIYFNTWGWIVSAWNKLLDWIGSWFS